MLSGGQSVAAGLDEVVPDWRDRALQERIVTVTVIASSVYMAIVFLCAGWLMSFGPAWVVFTVLLGLIWVMMASLQGFRVLRWRRRPEHYPPVSGWGVVTDGQAAMVLLVTLFTPGYALYSLFSEPSPYGWTAILAAVAAYGLVAVIVVPGVIMRHRRDAVIDRVLQRLQRQA